MKAHTLTHSHAHTLTRSHAHTLTRSHAHTLTHTHTLTRSHTHTLTHSHAHTLTHTHTRSHSFILLQLRFWLSSLKTAPDSYAVGARSAPVREAHTRTA